MIILTVFNSYIEHIKHWVGSDPHGTPRKLKDDKKIKYIIIWFLYNIIGVADLCT